MNTRQIIKLIDDERQRRKIEILEFSRLVGYNDYHWSNIRRRVYCPKLDAINDYANYLKLNLNIEGLKK